MELHQVGCIRSFLTVKPSIIYSPLSLSLVSIGWFILSTTSLCSYFYVTWQLFCCNLMTMNCILFELLISFNLKFYIEYAITHFRKVKKKLQTQNRLKTGSLWLLPNAYVVGILHRFRFRDSFTFCSQPVVVHLCLFVNCDTFAWVALACKGLFLLNSYFTYFFVNWKWARRWAWLGVMNCQLDIREFFMGWWWLCCNRQHTKGLFKVNHQIGGPIFSS